MRTPPLYIRAKVEGGKGGLFSKKNRTRNCCTATFFSYLYFRENVGFVCCAHTAVFIPTQQEEEKGRRHNLSYSPPSPRTTPSSSCCRANCNQVSGGGGDIHGRKNKKKMYGKSRYSSKRLLTRFFWGRGRFGTVTPDESIRKGLLP